MFSVDDGDMNFVVRSVFRMKRGRFFIAMVGILGFLFQSCLGFSPIDSLNFTGRVTDVQGNPLKAVAVSNGFDVVETDENGEFKIYKRSRANFVYITTPSGYRVNPFYQAISKESDVYNFELTEYGAKSNEAVNFLHITDTETASAGYWLDSLKGYVTANKPDFIIHTGDICYKDGMAYHSESVNAKAFGVPVYYAIGNHDLIDYGKTGESFYEENFGPVYYSFNSGGVHFIVTPMLSGDARPSYSKGQVAAWLKRDLSLISKETPIIIFNHDLYTFGDDFSYGNSSLSEYNLIAWAYGHWHINYFKEHGDSGVVSWTTAPPKGGIDHSPAKFRVVTTTPEGVISQEERYPFFNKYIELPALGKAVLYNTASDPEIIKYTPIVGGVDGSPLEMVQRSPLFWETRSPVPSGTTGANIRVIYQDGSIGEKRIDGFPQGLNWIANIGNEVFLNRPIVSGNDLYVASQDDSGKKEHRVVSIDIASGNENWTYATRQSVRNEMVLTGGRLGVADADSNIYILDAATGAVNHLVDSEMNGLAQNMTSTIERDGILYGGFSESLKAVNMESGEVLWRNRAWDGGEGTVTSLAIVGDNLLAGAFWRSFYAMNLKTGRLSWKKDFSGLGPAPIEDGGNVVLVHGEVLYTLNPKNGKVISEYPVEFAYQVAGSLAKATVNGLEAYIAPTTGDGIVALSKVDGSTLWNFKSGDALIFTSPYTAKGDEPLATVDNRPLVIGNSVYFGASDGFVYRVNLETGVFIEKWSLGSPIMASLTYSEAKNTIFVADFGGSIWSIPVASN